MARPARFNAEFFYHPASLRDDRRVKALRARFGPAGYAILIMLLETLTSADYTQLDTSELEIELLAGDYGVSVTEIHSLIQIAEKVGYFCRNEGGFLICPDLNKALEPVFEKRNRSRQAANSDRNRPSGSTPSVSVTETPVTVTENPQNKEEENKEEKSTVNLSSSLGTAVDFQKKEEPPAPPSPAPPPDMYFQFAAQLKSETQFEESTCMSLKLKREHLPGLIDQFTHEQRALSTAYRQFADYKSHAFNWLRSKASYLNAQKNNHGKPAAPPARTALGQGADLSGIVYRQESFK